MSNSSGKLANKQKITFYKLYVKYEWCPSADFTFTALLKISEVFLHGPLTSTEVVTMSFFTEVVTIAKNTKNVKTEN